MTKQEKEAIYQAAMLEIDAVLEGEQQLIMKMATINSILKYKFETYFWVGFYCVHQGALMVGPYQGTLGCLHIPFSKGVCGRAARTRQTQIVEDVHADPEHVACDARTNSEIVLPVFNPAGKLIAVFDIDSTKKGTFDEVDQQHLEAMLQKHFVDTPLQMSFDYS